MDEFKQVNKSHYEFQRYMRKWRWNSVWHQLDEVICLKPESVLEIGPGLGVFKNIAALFGVKVETLDIDPELKPDHVASVTALPFDDNSYDLVCAFQILEHLPYDDALKAFREIVRVSRGHVVISLPDARPVWRYHFYIPKLGVFDWLIHRPFHRVKRHQFDGEHHWEINKRNYLLSRVLADFGAICHLNKTYRVLENPYHRFLIFNCTNSD
jgi:SAM-dependent methyltransferase